MPRHSRKLVTCGCGNHMVATGAKQTISWNGLQWDARCAFNAVVESASRSTREVTRYRTAIRRLSFFKELVAKHVLCAACDQPVGHNFKVFGDNVYHSNCLHDIGGDG